ncbi:DNA starvation/stationary phase protection protein [Parvularcula sp. ZS-1/3]|uniref:DNA starvation/stationary phase protection protein n=1 Tax=Parvularcula mediterranea TaxID=2732508 RepID=A0A7Y3RJR3_9PROT|nr:DNA starvation/stationary phase protection protein [Parvularcula mediterranea]NNU15348.1 DNA starvation/stationary phase protection protein [Parvularcula mediterranea]
MATNKQITETLKRVLGNTYALYLKTHGYHWNVEGPSFKSLHELFEEQYTQMWQSIDEIAERIRMLGTFAPMGGEILAGATIDTADNSVPSANGMVQNLVAGHEAWLEDTAAALNEAEEAGDTATETLLGDLITGHEKMAWMLRASLER